MVGTKVIDYVPLHRIIDGLYEPTRLIWQHFVDTTEYIEKIAHNINVNDKLYTTYG